MPTLNDYPMAGESRNLGKGLEALLGGRPSASPSRGVGSTLPIASVKPGMYQPRQEMSTEALQELADSIKASGVIQPILVRRLPGSSAESHPYEIIAGERRWRAAQLAGLADIPAIVREVSDQQALAFGLIENIQREELSATDEARALKRLVSEFGLTQQAAADAVGRSRATVANLIRLLELPPSVVQLIDSKRLSMGHARALLGLEGPDAQIRLADKVVALSLSVRETEEAVRMNPAAIGEGTSTRKPSAIHIARSEILKTTHVRARLHQLPRGKGKLVVEFANAESRDELIALIKSYEGD